MEPQKSHWSKYLVRSLWPFEVLGIILYTMFLTLVGSTDRIVVWHDSLPLLTTLIGGQGVLIAAATEIKRWIETRRTQSVNNEGVG